MTNQAELISWSFFEVESQGESIPCSLGRGNQPPNGTLCVFLDKTRSVVEDPVSHFAGNPYPLDAILNGGAQVLVMLNPWQDLNELAERVRKGRDVFCRGVERVRAVCEHAAQAATARQTVLLGISRHGWLVLACAAYLDGISGVVATETVTSWPRLVEFQAMTDNPILVRHDLWRLTDRMRPCRVLLQVGYDDQRVGTAECKTLATRLTQSYAASGMPDRFTFELLAVKGHASSSSAASAMTGTQILDWLMEQGFLSSGPS